MHGFDYSAPQNISDAVKLGGGEAKYLAGGHTLIPTLKQRLAEPETLIDLGKINALKGITKEDNTLSIGAMTTHAEVANSPVVKAALSGLAALAGGIGDPHVRHRGTIGGSVANNDPAADYPAACLALGATIITNKRSIAADDFFTGMFDTALEDGELITKITFPTGGSFAYKKFDNPASRYAMVGVGVAKSGADVRVAVTGAGDSGVFRWSEAEAALSKTFASRALDTLELSPKGINADMHASSEYRAHLVGVMTRRAVDMMV